jgi:pimeloyl-ACP methyl ester carboxylesterase
MKPLNFLFALVLLGCWSGNLFAQPLRFELGQRTRAMELAWEAQPNAAARKRATTHLKQAVTLFFAFKLNDAAQQLDQARFALQSTAPLAPAAQWAESLYVLPETRLLDKTATSLAFTLDKLYPTMDDIPKGAMLRLRLASAGKTKPMEFPLASLPLQQQLPLALAKVADGDFTLTAQVVLGGKVLARSAQTISVVTNLQARVANLKASPLPSGTVEAETVASLAGLLDSLANKKTLEASFPAARWLAEVEAVRNAGAGFYGKAKTGQFWLTLNALPVRLLAPAAAKAGQPLPLVIALHGAGGSENMFFETYGAGAIARLCEQRGWLLLSPRGTGMKAERVAELIDAMDKLYPVDRRRVFLVGHSMGGGQTAAAANLAPEKFAGVAVLGGGGAVRNATEAFQKLPFFIGVGTEDFAMRNAKALHEALQKAAVKHINYRAYADIEHLTIVQVALPEVFTFFDERAKKK